MCGIVGYVGPQQAQNVVIEGLRRLEYRGYDSAGIAIVSEQAIQTRKKAGKLANLEAELVESPISPSHTGIGHTRWATHGAPNDVNAHPHVSEDGSIAVIHNGIIENFAMLRDKLIADGVTLRSQTDTEVVAHLLSKQMKTTPGLADALREVCQVLTGAFTLVVVHADTPDVVVAARRNSPLVVGRGDGENFLASDVAAFIAHTRNAIELGQDQIVEITPNSIEVTDFFGKPADYTEYEVTWDAAAAEKGGFDLFMLKEIAEQPKAVADTLLGRIDKSGKVTLADLGLDDAFLKTIDKIIITRPNVAAGKSIGYFPGTLEEKMMPWVMPVLEVLHWNLGKGAVETGIKNGNIEIAPFETMRGRSFQDAFVILDEAQNVTPHEMKMFLTRIGENCKVVLNGDIMQSDLGETSGLSKAIHLAKKHMIPVPVVEFTADDIVRSVLCKQWIMAFMKEGL